jgi:3-deoxy-D-manno-octulosonate 8-phosphate phosphatase (KDO 8-P phosphatase)
MTDPAVPITLLVLDVDGVITDGTILLLESGDEARSVHFHDLDAVARARRAGIAVAILSGEDTAASRRLALRFDISEAVWGAKDKRAGLIALADRLGFALTEVCYVGDADRDAPALAVAGLGLAPNGATPKARAAADHVLSARGGRGAVAEAVGLIQGDADPVEQS